MGSRSGSTPPQKHSQMGHNRLRISHSVQLAAEAAATTPPDSQQKRDTQSSCGGRLCGRTSLSPLIPALALRRARGCFVRARRRAQPSSMRRQGREDLDRGASPRQLGGAISADAADVTQIKPISHLRSSASSADGLFGILSENVCVCQRAHSRLSRRNLGASDDASWATDNSPDERARGLPQSGRRSLAASKQMPLGASSP